MAKTILVTGAGGAQFAVDPDVKWVAAQLKSGALTKGGKGSGGNRPAPDPETGGGESSTAKEPASTGDGDKPPQSANKAEWIDFAVAQLGLDRETAESYSKQDLIDLANGE